jgi:hypothetical protein
MSHLLCALSDGNAEISNGVVIVYPNPLLTTAELEIQIVDGLAIDSAPIGFVLFVFLCRIAIGPDVLDEWRGG